LVSESAGPDSSPQPPAEITAVLDNIVQDWEGQNAFAEEYRRITGIGLNIVQPSHQQYMNKLLIRLSSGELPDVCEILPEYLPQLVSEGVPVPLNQYIREAEHLGSVDPEKLDAVRYKDGTIYGVQSRDGGGCVTYIRKDWLENLNLEVPTNWDELLTVMRAFTFDDPDGNGRDDTVGYTDVNAASCDWYNRAIMLDAHVEIYYRDGRWVDGFTEPQMEEALRRLRSLYIEGVIDRDFITNTTYSARAKVFNGQVGIFTYWANHWARNLYDRTRKGSDPNARIEPIPAIRGAQYISRVAPLLIITRGAEDPEFVFRNFIDLQYDKGPVQKLFTYGVEGYHWKMENGEMQFLINELDPYKVQYTKAYVPPDSILNDWALPMPLDPLVKPALAILHEDPYQERLKVGGDFYEKYYLEIEKSLKPEILAMIVTGAYTVEQGLSEYERRSGELFIEEILSELNS